MWNKSPISGRPKQEKPNQKTIEKIVNGLSTKDATNLDLFLKGMQHQKEQDKNKYSEEEVLNILDILLSEYRDSLKNKTDFYPALRFEQFKKK